MGKKKHKQIKHHDQNGKAGKAGEANGGVTGKGAKKQKGKGVTKLPNGKGVHHQPHELNNNNNSPLPSGDHKHSDDVIGSNGHTPSSNYTPLTNGRVLNGKPRLNGRNGVNGSVTRNGRTSRSPVRNSRTESVLLNRVSLLTGVLVALYIGYNFALYLQTLNENRLWFSNIKVIMTLYFLSGI